MYRIGKLSIQPIYHDRIQSHSVQEQRCGQGNTD